MLQLSQKNVVRNKRRFEGSFTEAFFDFLKKKLKIQDILQKMIKNYIISRPGVRKKHFGC